MKRTNSTDGSQINIKVQNQKLNNVVADQDLNHLSSKTMDLREVQSL